MPDWRRVTDLTMHACAFRAIIIAAVELSNFTNVFNKLGIQCYHDCVSFLVLTDSAVQLKTNGKDEMIRYDSQTKMYFISGIVQVYDKGGGGWFATCYANTLPANFACQAMGLGSGRSIPASAPSWNQVAEFPECPSGSLTGCRVKIRQRFCQVAHMECQS